MRTNIKQTSLNNIKKYCDEISKSFAKLSLELDKLIDSNEESDLDTAVQAEAFADSVQQSVAIATKVEDAISYK